MTNEELIEEHNQKVYGGAMTAHNKHVLRKMLESEEHFWVYEARDFQPSDAGEPPEGAQW